MTAFAGHALTSCLRQSDRFQLHPANGVRSVLSGFRAVRSYQATETPNALPHWTETEVCPASPRVYAIQVYHQSTGGRISPAFRACVTHQVARRCRASTLDWCCLSPTRNQTRESLNSPFNSTNTRTFRLKISSLCVIHQTGHFLNFLRRKLYPTHAVEGGTTDRRRCDYQIFLRSLS